MTNNEGVGSGAASHEKEPEQDRRTQDRQYTGVIVIHGIGDEKRNATLQEAVNALTYWFNHTAGLALRPDGPGRVWIASQLPGDDDLDALAARATLELEPPASDGSDADVDAHRLVLHLREVWWAQAFGTPSIAEAIKWARIQLRDQATRIRFPTSQLDDPAAERPSIAPPGQLSGHPFKRPGSDARTARARRAMLNVLLWVYGRVQFVWKLAQWITLTPLISALLLIIGFLRLFAFIPFVRSGLLTAMTRVVDYLALHWISSMEVYMLDYTRSSAIRHLFERELEDFLGDPACDRIIVIAHSMGTVISYEGLCTTLARPGWHRNDKQITFICLAQGLRRFWLLQRTDVRRLRNPLPASVGRWVHFWARYDPVSAGPLSAAALPRLVPEADPSGSDPYPQLLASLSRCTNVQVVNTDSTFTDHTTYWQNLDEVVGPIAVELVAGHPTLEPLVRAHLASVDEVLGRRWNIAWRALVAIASGFGFAALLFALDAYYQGNVGRTILGAIGGIIGSSPVQSFLESNIPFYTAVRSYLQSGSQAQSLADIFLNPNLTLSYLVTHFLTPGTVATAVTAILLVGAGTLLTGRVLSEPSPFRYSAVAPSIPGARTVFSLSTIGIMLAGLTLALALVIVGVLGTGPTSAAAQELTWPWILLLLVFSAFQVAALASFGAALLDAARTHRWGWLVVLPVIRAVFIGPRWSDLSAFHVGESLVYVLALLGVALVGLCIALPAALRARHWGLVAALSTLIGLVAYSAAATGNGNGLGVDVLYGALGGFVLVPVFQIMGAILPIYPLMYGLWAGHAELLNVHERSRRPSVPLALTFFALAVVALSRVGAGIPPALSVALCSVAWCACVLNAIRSRQWGWVVAIPVLTTLAYVLLLIVHPIPGGENILSQLVSSVDASPVIASLLTGALSYALWEAPSTKRSTAKTA
jgi:hypothetical protein